MRSTQDVLRLNKPQWAQKIGAWSRRLASGERELNSPWVHQLNERRAAMKEKQTLRVAAPKPRNHLVAFALRRKAGSHQARKRQQNVEQKDLVQRLRESGLL